MVRSGLIKLLEPFKEFIIIGEASDDEEAVAMTKKLEPDVVIIDLSMPKLSGVEATKIIRYYAKTRHSRCRQFSTVCIEQEAKASFRFIKSQGEIRFIC
jgi:DNA-binding NarL/FixJ family response regulator